MRRFLPVALAAAAAAAAAAPTSFSAGLAMTRLNATEQTLLNHTVAGQGGAALTYFWITGDAAVATATIRMYVDGEAAPSLVFEPAKAAGVGIRNTTRGDVPPWSARWMGSLGRNAYFLTFRVPFQRSLAVTFAGAPAAAWLQARGAEGLALDDVIAGVTLPPTARLRLQVRENVTYSALEYMTIADVTKGNAGALFLTTAWWATDSPNTIEGCWRAFTPRDAAWPGLQLSTGWEDYYAGSWGFVAGPFTNDMSGVTYYTAPGNLATSAYRFHTHDPVFFNDGLLLVMRNGETSDANGMKCTQQAGGPPFGRPGTTTLSTYAWYYTW
jgi:hypothetical protein